MILKDGTTELDVELSEAAKGVCISTRVLYEKSGYEVPWVGYLVMLDNNVVGTCAFRSKPILGRVEIAYFTFPEHEGKGIATEMAKELISIAGRQDPNVKVFALTLPQENASTAVLRKCLFHKSAEIMHPEDGFVWEWEL